MLPPGPASWATPWTIADEQKGKLRRGSQLRPARNQPSSPLRSVYHGTFPGKELLFHSTDREMRPGSELPMAVLTQEGDSATPPQWSPEAGALTILQISKLYALWASLPSCRPYDCPECDPGWALHPSQPPIPLLSAPPQRQTFPLSL